MQITFDAPTASQALTAGPHEIVVFQHSGGEHTSWSDPRVQKQGRHPIVYSAAGSHATFYSSALWLGTGQNGSGVGCDNTTAPLTAFRPRPVLLPDTIPQTGNLPGLTTTVIGDSGKPASTTGRRVRIPRRSGGPVSWMDATRTRSPEVPGNWLKGSGCPTPSAAPSPTCPALSISKPRPRPARLHSDWRWPSWLRCRWCSPVGGRSNWSRCEAPVPRADHSRGGAPVRAAPWLRGPDRSCRPARGLAARGARAAGEASAERRQLRVVAHRHQGQIRPVTVAQHRSDDRHPVRRGDRDRLHP